MSTTVNTVPVSWEGYTPLHYYASRWKRLEVTRFLLEHDAHLNAQTTSHETALYLASRMGHFEIVRLLVDVTVQGMAGQTPYQIATQNGYRDVAQLLLEHGAERIEKCGGDRSTNTCVSSSETD